jgi:hypothetical protein
MRPLEEEEGMAETPPLRPAHAVYESTSFRLISARRERLERLAELSARALEELRERRDPTLAFLVTRLEGVRKRVLHELRYLHTAPDPPASLPPPVD